VRASAPAPLRATHHARTDGTPFGADDAPSASSSSGFGSFYAVTARDADDPPDSWSHAAFEVARAPAIVVLRDIARPG
jgi:hypothetical protein